ncbi:MAG: riboflavin synthase [Gemmatimonadota bacterium]|nr:riboflavin synthase [Gemmatimonadota bacterium]
MFTGIVTRVGSIEALEVRSGGRRLTVRAGDLVSTLRPGDSVSVAGICLTATDVEEDTFTVDAVETTLSRTTLGEWEVGTEVNLERALGAGEPLGGHLVQGHVDEVAEVCAIEASGETRRLAVRLGEATRRVTVNRGSLTVDGVSLTVAGLEGNIAEFAIIPYTWSHTTLRRLAPGSRVNVEADLIGKYVQRLFEPYTGSGGPA